MNLNTSKWTSYKRLLFMALLGTGVSLSAFADKTISGNVKDDQGQPAIGATVQVEGTTIGTMTDLDGNYTLTVPDNTTEVTISYVGLATQTVKIKGNIANADMKADDKTLDDVVVVGYQTVKKRDVVASTASVGADQIKNLPVTDAAQAMQGKLAGVQVTTAEGSPDAEVSVRVHGGNSLTQSNDPLYIVDGFQVSSINDIPPSDIQSIDVLKDAAATAIYGAQGANGVVIITTKDADVDDKNGDCKMAFNVDYTGYLGWKTLAKKYDLMNGRDFALMQYEHTYLSQKGYTNPSKIEDKFNKYFDFYYKAHQDDATVPLTPIATLLDSIANKVSTTDWQEEIFGENALTSNHSISVSGGNKNATFNFSYNRIDDEGIMRGSDYTRNNLRLKTKFKPFKDFTIGTNFRYTNTVVEGAGSNSADGDASSSESRVRNIVGYTPIELSYMDEFLNNPANASNYSALVNPYLTVDENYKLRTDNKWDISGYASYKFLKDFTWRSEVGYQSSNRVTNRFYGPTTYFSRQGDGFTGAGGVGGYSSAQKTEEISSRLRQSNTLNWKHKFGGKHNLDVLLGQEIVMNNGEQIVFEGYGYNPVFTGEEIFNLLSNKIDDQYTYYAEPKDNTLSFFGRGTYDYKGKYYATLTMRADATSRFSEDNRWGYFPAFAGAWRISDEPWMRPIVRAAKISNLKLRLSYGKAGNNSVDLGHVFSEYVTTSTSYLSTGDTYLSVGGGEKIAANPDLKWETTTTRDLGLDYGFFNDRLSGALDLYWNTTDDLIIKYKMPMLYTYQYRNVASTENKGVDFSVHGVILDKRSKNLNYDLTVDANLSHNTNKVKDLGGLTNYPIATAFFNAYYANMDIEYMLEEGESVGRIYGYKSDGWYTADDFDSFNKNTDTWTLKSGVATNTIVTTGLRPGVVKMQDLNGDGIINADDRTIIGNTMADFTGGFSISGHIGSDNWGSVDAAANFTYSYGNDVLNLMSMNMSTVHDQSILRNLLNDCSYGSRYSLFTSDGAYIPASAADDGAGLVTGANYDALANSLRESNAGASTFNPSSTTTILTDQFVEDGSFLRLASVTLGYSLPEKWISKVKLTKARFFFTASNLFVLTDYSGSDPEVNVATKKNPLAIGVDWSAYPRSRNFNFGVNLSF